MAPFTVPTDAPSIAPYVAPSISPTHAPVLSPTDSPFVSPSTSPSMLPSSSPSNTFNDSSTNIVEYDSTIPRISTDNQTTNSTTFQSINSPTTKQNVTTIIAIPVVIGCIILILSVIFLYKYLAKKKNKGVIDDDNDEKQMIFKPQIHAAKNIYTENIHKLYDEKKDNDFEVDQYNDAIETTIERDTAFEQNKLRRAQNLDVVMPPRETIEVSEKALSLDQNHASSFERISIKETIIHDDEWDIAANVEENLLYSNEEDNEDESDDNVIRF